jgi:predicted DNA-binding protein with PD1-like motif
MKAKLIDPLPGSAAQPAQPARTFAVIFQTGDEVIAGLKGFARDQNLAGSHFTAIGAFSGATLAYFDWRTKQYQTLPISEQVEALTLAGDIALKEGKPEVHAHVVVGLRDGTTRGGHLMEAHVRPTLEVILTESPVHMQRTFDPESGLALIDPGAFPDPPPAEEIP